MNFSAESSSTSTACASYSLPHSWSRWPRGLVTRDRFALGYAIYGSFFLLGFVIPSTLWRVEAGFPSLFVALGAIQSKFRWLSLAIVGGLAVLLLHLALYPWPAIANEPKHYAGLTALQARNMAINGITALRSGMTTELTYSAQTRGIDEGGEAWLVYFRPAEESGAQYAGCFVVVTKRAVEPTPECSA